MAALAVLTAGTIISASGDLSFSPWGYAYTTLANCFTIGYTLRMRAISSSGQAQAGDDGDKGKTRGHLGVLDLTLYIALLSLPLLVVCRCARIEPRSGCAPQRRRRARCRDEEDSEKSGLLSCGEEQAPLPWLRAPA